MCCVMCDPHAHAYRHELSTKAFLESATIRGKATTTGTATPRGRERQREGVLRKGSPSLSGKQPPVVSMRLTPAVSLRTFNGGGLMVCAHACSALAFFHRTQMTRKPTLTHHTHRRGFECGWGRAGDAISTPTHDSGGTRYTHALNSMQNVTPRRPHGRERAHTRTHAPTCMHTLSVSSTLARARTDGVAALRHA